MIDPRAPLYAGRLPAALAAALLALGAVACGQAHSGSAAPRLRSAAYAQAPPVELKGDEDEDGLASANEHAGTGADSDSDSSGNTYYDWDDGNVLYWGHAAGAEDAAAVTAAIERYFATAAGGDGAAACRLLSARMAAAVLSDYGNAPGLSALHGGTCAVVMSKLLAELHVGMSTDHASLKVGIVRIQGATAEALLGFGAGWPNSYTALQRERGAWRITELQAQELP